MGKGNISKKDLLRCAGKALLKSAKKMVVRDNIIYRTIALLVAFATVFTLGFSSPALYAENTVGERYITAIGSIDEEVAVQHLTFGASESDIVFPDSINATVETYKEVLIEEEVLEEEILEEEMVEETVDVESDAPTTEEVVESEENPENEEVEEVLVPESDQEVVEENVDGETTEATEETVVEKVTETTDTTEAAEPTVDSTEATPVEAAPSAESAAPSEDNGSDPVAFVVDLLFPAMVAQAAEIEDAEELAPTAEPTYRVETITTSAEVMISGISWSLDPERSTGSTFDSSIEGAKYVYVPNIPGEYKVNASLPVITVIIGTADETSEFVQSVVVDGVLITVKADKGVFPEGATLSARSATEVETAIAEEAVESERESEDVAASYTFDIKVVDAAGNEIQPDTTKGTVTVSFALEEANNELLEADIYHITDENPDNPEAEKLDTQNINNTVEAETTGFSFYTVEFTYNDKQYVLDGNSEVYLSEILETFGIDGEVTEAYSSNPDLFNVYYIRNNWRVAAVNPFTSLETLTVVVDGVTHEIPVTDSQVDVQDGSLKYDDDNGKSAESLVNLVLSDGITATNAKKTGTVYTFSNGDDDIGISQGIVLDTSGQVANNEQDPQLSADVASWNYDYGGDTSSLEFEMVAEGNLLNFNYAFASREFDQSSNFNDAFGLYVKVNNEPYKNIAQLTRTDGSQVPVTIVNLRAGESGTEMSNGGSTDIDSCQHTFFHKTSIVMTGKESSALNGISNVFNAQIPVNIGDHVILKFVICDCGDTGYNSYVFIEGGSLSFNPNNEGKKQEDQSNPTPNTPSGGGGSTHKYYPPITTTEPTDEIVPTEEPTDLTVRTEEEPVRDREPEPKPTEKDDVIEDDNAIGLGNIIDRGDIWGNVSDETKQKLLDKLNESGGEIIQAESLDNMESVPVTDRPIAYVIGEGSVIVTLEYKGNEERSASLADAAAVANSILTPEQRAAVAAGSILEIKVEVTPIDTETVPELDRQVIDDGVVSYSEELPALTMADYLDISMFFRLDEEDWNQVTDTDPIDIVISIPEQYLGLSDTYYIMRAHEGKSTLLYDTDDDPNTITISTGQFSTYALLYEDPQAVVSTVELDHVCYIHWIILFVAIVGVAGIYVGRRKRGAVYAVDAVDAVAMFILSRFGTCSFDLIALVIGIIALAIMTYTVKDAAGQETK
ncbi:choice-of-anchor L domain-containing protein [Pseudobutyrivibrio sp.]|uniref:choice-of-anchor L domain-containing protein n=1 Tax=Pseudobutyrivibrio sp. TaxID=2014367 RepID=UPI001DB58553|nr:choice-of-anchor L domain-containing protein [Pseudobutyrivibrio sp.]MBE5911860.1 hypothetical protein [Pseudobutyrivibrio sp.]